MASKQEIFARAWARWHELQFDMVMEECAELIQAVVKFRRGITGSLEHLAEETADVELMCEQLRAMGNGFDELVDKHKVAKLARLGERLGIE